MQTQFYISQMDREDTNIQIEAQFALKLTPLVTREGTEITQRPK